MSDVTIRLRDNGPLVIDGPVKVIDAEGNEFTIDRVKPLVALCRCGHSLHKPFCDGSHREAGFESIERARPPLDLP